MTGHHRLLGCLVEILADDIGEETRVSHLASHIVRRSRAAEPLEHMKGKYAVAEASALTRQCIGLTRQDRVRSRKEVKLIAGVSVVTTYSL